MSELIRRCAVVRDGEGRTFAMPQREATLFVNVATHAPVPLVSKDSVTEALGRMSKFIREDAELGIIRDQFYAGSAQEQVSASQQIMDAGQTLLGRDVISRISVKPKS